MSLTISLNWIYEIIVQIAEIPINPIVEVDVAIVKERIWDSPQTKYF